MSEADALRKAWIRLVQKALNSVGHIRGEMYEVITGDYETYDRICDDLRIMIERLQSADDERFLRGEGELADAERRRLEQFGV